MDEFGFHSSLQKARKGGEVVPVSGASGRVCFEDVLLLKAGEDIVLTR
jgi:hypothetical protein